MVSVRTLGTVAVDAAMSDACETSATDRHRVETCRLSLTQ